ncbi:hypothetical protein SAMN05421754_103115 [Nitrosomonas sp. Nm58]|nr:hypothetical protein SAMN05421754_103115 [Nitrosomonas sp. Nm58]
MIAVIVIDLQIVNSDHGIGLMLLDNKFNLCCKILRHAKSRWDERINGIKSAVVPEFSITTKFSE